MEARAIQELMRANPEMGSAQVHVDIDLVFLYIFAIWGSISKTQLQIVIGVVYTLLFGKVATKHMLAFVLIQDSC